LQARRPILTRPLKNNSLSLSAGGILERKGLRSPRPFVLGADLRDFIHDS
jgi:hypothetical protein